jgi:hypothetical protein
VAWRGSARGQMNGELPNKRLHLMVRAGRMDAAHR